MAVIVVVVVVAVVAVVAVGVVVVVVVAVVSVVAVPVSVVAVAVVVVLENENAAWGSSIFLATRRNNFAMSYAPTSGLGVSSLCILGRGV